MNARYKYHLVSGRLKFSHIAFNAGSNVSILLSLFIAPIPLLSPPRFGICPLMRKQFLLFPKYFYWSIQKLTI